MRLAAIAFCLGAASGVSMGFISGMAIVMSRNDGPIQRLQIERDRAREAAETCLFGAPQTN